MNGICDHPGCSFTAQKRPTLVVTSRRPPEPAPVTGDLFFTLHVGEDRYIHHLCVVTEFCDYHAGTFNPRMWVNDATWDALDNHARCLGFEPPARDGHKVLWEDAANERGMALGMDAQLASERREELKRLRQLIA